MKLPWLGPVVPPHVFCLLDDSVTYARVRTEAPHGFEEVRNFRYPAGSLASRAGGAPLVTREAIAEAVKAARALAGGRLARASAVFPDSWARILPVELEAIPSGRDAAIAMIAWKWKKLLPQAPADLALVYEAMPVLSGENRVLAAAAPREAIAAIERAFEEAGVRLGYLAPASLALFDGLAPALAAAAEGDYALLHRSGGVLSFFIARGRAPILFRQRPPDAEEEQDREARLSLSYYAERLKGPGIRAVFVHDEKPSEDLSSTSAFPVAPVAISAQLLGADRDFEARVQARPELLAGFAAVYGKR